MSELRRRNDGTNGELAALYDEQPQPVAAVAEARYDGSVVCLEATLVVLAFAAVVLSLLVYWRQSRIEDKLNMLLPNSTEMMAQQQTLHMQTMRETVEAFRKRQSGDAN